MGAASLPRSRSGRRNLLQNNTNVCKLIQMFVETDVEIKNGNKVYPALLLTHSPVMSCIIAVQNVVSDGLKSLISP